MGKKPTFRTRARVIKQLGEQLIKNESIALLELIKNAYDADASVCSVIMLSPDDKDEGLIRIHDDGEGMDYDTLCNVWLEIEYTHVIPEHTDSAVLIEIFLQTKFFLGTQCKYFRISVENHPLKTDLSDVVIIKINILQGIRLVVFINHS